MNQDLIFSVSDFVAVFNQTIAFAYPKVSIVGEVSDFRISKNKWVYFNLKDDDSSIRFFGTIYQLVGPIEDGMKLKVTGLPGLHPRFGFNITISSMSLAGEGTIKRAAALLEKKLEKEGLFAEERKRELVYPPTRVGLITSSQSAAYHDFLKILNGRWSGVEISHYDIQVQGEDAPAQIIEGIKYLNSRSEPVEVLVITRGGGSSEDLQAFNNELVVRAVAASRIPTVVAIGHERDMSLAEKTADKRASTPSNAAELLVPDRASEAIKLKQSTSQIDNNVSLFFRSKLSQLAYSKTQVAGYAESALGQTRYKLELQKQLLGSIKPSNILKKGYAIVRRNKKSISRSVEIRADDRLVLEFYDGKKQVRAI